MDRDVPVVFVGDDDPVTTGALDGLDLAVTPVDVDWLGAELVCGTWGLVVVVVVVVVVVPVLDGTGVLTVDDTGDTVEVLRVVSAPVVVDVGVVAQRPPPTSEAKQQQFPQRWATS